MTKPTQLASLVASGRASNEEMGRLGAETVAHVKTHPEILQVRGRGSEIITKSESKRQISYVVSDETPDRMGDIIKVNGWDLSQYKKNPVILWAHDGSSVPPIGRAANVRRRYSPSARLTADIEFAPKEAYEFADTIYQLASRGFIRATSVGFMPMETEEVDEAKRKKLGLGTYGQLFSKAELMEVSVVAVPANPAALELGVKSLMSEGVIEKVLANRFLEEYPRNEEAALKKVKSICRSFVDFGALSSSQKQSPLDSYNEEDPVEVAIPEAMEAELEETSPPCQQEDEAPSECVERKATESVEGETRDDQAVAVASSACETDHSEKSAIDTKLVEAVAWLIEQQAEQTKATRQLVDALTDLTKSIHSDLPSGVQGDGSVSEPDVATPDVEEKAAVDFEGILEGRLRGFAEGLRRDLHLSSNTENNR